MSSIDIARRVFQLQAEAITATGQSLGPEFDKAVELLFNCRGHVIVCGMGKSGIIGNKIAATLASTGTPSFSIHPAEAYHGDLGMITSDDVAILISYSGETDEVIRLIPSLQHFGTPIIALVGKPDSSLGKNADIMLNVAVEREACPNNLAPTTSTTVTLAMGDALAVALIEQRQFSPQQFAVFHPGGSLGRRLLTRVRDVMHRDAPTNVPGDSFKDVIVTMTEGGLGITVVQEQGEIRGIITDGDLRRALLGQEDINGVTAADIMSRNPKTVAVENMFAEAEQIMYQADITALLAVDEDGKLAGVLKLQDAREML